MNVNIQAWGVQSVVGGSTLVNVVGTFLQPYQVIAMTDWGAQCWYSNHQPSLFTLNFTTAAPGGGGNVHYIVTGGSSVAVVLASGSINLDLNQSFAVISGSFPASYAVIANTSFASFPFVQSPTTTKFTIGWSTAAPAGSVLNYIVVAPSGTPQSVSIIGGNSSIASGGNSLSIAGSFATPYQTFATPNWNSTVYIPSVSKGSSSVTFGTVAPSSQFTDWVIISPNAQTLSGIQTSLNTYLTDTRSLLRDNAPGNTYTTADLTRYINRAIKQRDLDLGLNRIKYSFTLTALQTDYTFLSIVQSGSLMTGNPYLELMDITSFVIIPLGPATSAMRYPVARRPYSDLAPLMSISYPTYPVAYCLYGPETIVLAPPPAKAYACEIDFIGYSPDLVNLTDLDYMPYPYSDPVPFLAASFAKMSLQRFDEAATFKSIYDERKNMVMGKSRAFAVSDPYASPMLRRR